MIGSFSYRPHWRALLLTLLAAVLLIALALRLWRIDSLPPGFHLDESFEGLEAWRILTDPSYRPIFLTGNFGVAPLNAYANAFTFWLWGMFGGVPGPTAMRVTASVAGVLTVLAVYALANEIRRRDPHRLSAAFPLLAAAVLATLRWHIHFSRLGIEPVYVPLIWAGATWLFLRGWRMRSWVSFSACGVLLAGAMYTYQGAWVIPLLMVPVTAHLWWNGRKRGEGGAGLRGSVLAAAVALLLVLPLGLFFADHLDLLVLRPAQIAVTGAASEAHAAATPLGNALASALMFVPLAGTGDIDPRRNLPGEAALNWWQFLPFAAGLVIALWRVRNPAYSAILIGLVGMMLPGVFSEYAPHFHRILGAAAPTALLCALGLDALLRWGQSRRSGENPTWPVDRAPLTPSGSHPTYEGEPVSLPAMSGSHPTYEGSPTHPADRRSDTHSPTHLLAIALVAALILAGAITAGRDYFVRWAALPDLFHAFDAGLWELGQEIARQPAEGETAGPVYLSPRPVDHPTLAFALNVPAAAQGDPVSYDGRQVFPLTDGANAQPERYYVIEHEDFRTRLLLPEVLPGAVISAVVADPAGGAYANVYLRPVGEEAQRAPQVTLGDGEGVPLGDGIRLLGYDVLPEPLRAGEVLYLQLHWLADAQPAGDWVVFTHLLAPDGAGGFTQVAGKDDRPGGGSLVTTRWQDGWRVLDEYQMALPADLAPGVYTLAVGLYQDGGDDITARLPADGAGLLLGEVTIEP